MFPLLNYHHSIVLVLVVVLVLDLLILPATTH
jgi:hypothetical protein